MGCISIRTFIVDSYILWIILRLSQVHNFMLIHTGYSEVLTHPYFQVVPPSLAVPTRPSPEFIVPICLLFVPFV